MLFTGSNPIPYQILFCQSSQSLCWMGSLHSDHVFLPVPVEITILECGLPEPYSGSAKLYNGLVQWHKNTCKKFVFLTRDNL